jgi:hypothetical protein
VVCALRVIAELLEQFEAIAHTEQGVEYRFARELQPLLAYDRWQNIAALLDRAKTACAGAEQAVADLFREVTKMVALGSGAARAVEDAAGARRTRAGRAVPTTILPTSARGSPRAHSFTRALALQLDCLQRVAAVRGTAR